MRKGAALFAALGLAVAAQADPSLECSVSNNSQVEIAACLGAIEIDVNAALDIAFAAAMTAALDLDNASGRSVAVPALELAQKDWIAFRQSHCDHIGALFGGGSGTGIAIRSCRIEMTRQRTDALFATLS